jgi:hypothetical protein
MSAGQITQGRRIYPDAEGKLHFALPGDYGKGADGKWKARLPSFKTVEDADFAVGVGFLQTIIEHEDGTITASPSILWDASCMPNYPETSWHGYLECGVWKEC